MTVTVKNIIPAKTAENIQTTQYTATGVSTIIDKFTATNYDTSAHNISVNLSAGSTATGNDNIIVYNKTLQAGETYTFPELVGHVLPPTGYISTIASAINSINIRASGREVTQ